MLLSSSHYAGDGTALRHLLLRFQRHAAWLRAAIYAFAADIASATEGHFRRVTPLYADTPLPPPLLRFSHISASFLIFHSFLLILLPLIRLMPLMPLFALRHYAADTDIFCHAFWLAAFSPPPRHYAMPLIFALDATPPFFFFFALFLSLLIIAAFDIVTPSITPLITFLHALFLRFSLMTLFIASSLLSLHFSLHYHFSSRWYDFLRYWDCFFLWLRFLRWYASRWCCHAFRHDAAISLSILSLIITIADSCHYAAIAITPCLFSSSLPFRRYAAISPFLSFSLSPDAAASFRHTMPLIISW